MPTDLEFVVAGEGAQAVHLRHATVAGWTGRERAAVDRHIAELGALGVAPPSEVPLFYRVSATLMTHARAIEVVGSETSGEVEPVVIDDGTALFLGLGSDHTDRALEAHSVAMAKQVCAKPLAGDLWRFEEVAGHLDTVALRAWIRDGADDAWELYQEGTLAGIRPLADLVARAPGAAGDGRLSAGTIMMCGTLPTLGPVRPAGQVALQMHDPVAERTIERFYEVVSLPVVA